MLDVNRRSELVQKRREFINRSNYLDATRKAGWMMMFGLISGLSMNAALEAQSEPGSGVPTAYTEDTFRRQQANDSLVENRLTSVARRFSTDQTLAVGCVDMSGFDDDTSDKLEVFGVYLNRKQTSTETSSIFLAPVICDLIDNEDAKPLDQELATFLLAHEIAHAQGWKHEGETNCAAVSLFPDVHAALYGEEEFLYDPLSLAQNTGGTREYRAFGC